LVDLRPIWTFEPDIEILTGIVRRQLDLPESFPCVVKFLAEGAFNKVYSVQCGNNTDVVVRVTLPVQPRLKTLRECATIQYIKHHTEIPAPLVFRYSVQRDDPLRFEWMIMERVAGTKVKDQWRHMSWLKKQLLVHKIVAYLSQLFRNRFNQLGNIYAPKDIQEMTTEDKPDTVLLGAEHSCDKSGFVVGEIVSLPFFYDDHWSIGVFRGPYKHSRDWLTAYLQLAIHDAEKMKEEDDKEDSSKEFTENSAKLGVRMLRLLPSIFPADNPEEYVLHHQDLSSNNMMVDENYDLSGIIDWECVHTVPLWLACQLPQFLRGQERESPPPFAADFENQYYEQAYYDDIEIHEKTCLREYFLEEMKRVCPEWVSVHDTSDIKADFEFAVSVCTVRGYGLCIDEWLDAVENGEKPDSLREDL
ncbi:kinase-like protein, partial [Pyrenochaeta sp. MPI-SDFR-AT-0127]